MFSKFKIQFSKQASPGFTFLEIIIVIIILGILAASIGYKISSMKSDTSGIVAVDQVIADIQYVQVQAMGSLNLSQQKNVVFTIGSNLYTISGETRKLPNGVVVTATDLPGNTLTFNSLGEPTFGSSNKTITFSGGRTITIHAITGKVE